MTTCPLSERHSGQRPHIVEPHGSKRGEPVAHRARMDVRDTMPIGEKVPETHAEHTLITRSCTPDTHSGPGTTAEMCHHRRPVPVMQKGSQPRPPACLSLFTAECF